MELAREKSFKCHLMLKNKSKFRRKEQNKHLLLHDCSSRMHAESSRMHAECFKMNAEGSRMHAECARMSAECSKMHADL